MAKGNCACWGICATVAAVITAMCIILISTSVHVLDTSQVGIAYYYASGKINTEKLYTQGTHAIGPFSYFIVYPISTSSELITLNARTGDGMSFTLTVGFQYRISASLDGVLTLFKKWGKEDYATAIYFIAMNSIRDSAATFDISQFVFNRTVVESGMRSYLNLALSTEQVILDSFQLLALKFPPTFADAISNTQGAALQINAALSQQAQTLEQLQGLIDKSVILSANRRSDHTQQNELRHNCAHNAH